VCRRLRAELLLTVAGATLATLLVVFVPETRFAYWQPALHVALETAAALLALLAALMIFRRFRLTGCLCDLLVVLALGLTSSANMVLAVIPAAVSGGVAGEVPTWFALACQLAGAVVLAAAALRPDRRVYVAWWVPALAVAVMVALGATVARQYLPEILSPYLSPGTSERPSRVGHPAILAAHAVSAATYAVAVYGFARRAIRNADGLLRWLSIGCVLALFAFPGYFFHTSVHPEWIYTGDGFRLLSHGVILVGATTEIRRYWRIQTEVAVLQERRRMARDLHDGLVQELAFIHRNALRLNSEEMIAARIRASANRALVEARHAIHALSQPVDEPLDVLLAEAVNDVAYRQGRKVDVALDPDIQLSPVVQGALVRIACEAVTNACLHADAARIRVELRGGTHPLLRVSDDGQGFDPARARAGRRGFGLISMQERARSIGGRLRIRSAPARGTQVEVRL